MCFVRNTGKADGLAYVFFAVLDAALRGEQKLDEEKIQALLVRFSMKAIAERLTAFFYSLLDR